jgi:hypothetical protein
LVKDESLPSPETRDFALTLVRKAEQDEAILVRLLGDPEVADEVLGFHLQQAVEKRLKAVLAYHEVDFKRSHSIGYLTSLLAQNGVDLPACCNQIETLSPWAGDARYEDDCEGALDRPTVPGLVDTMAAWSSELLEDATWLASTTRLLQSFAKHGVYDHVALLAERELEAFVIHVTVDGSAWGGSIDDLTVQLIVSAFEEEKGEVISVVPSDQPKTMGDGLATVAGNTFESLNATQVLLLVRSGKDFSFMWWHVTAERTLTADAPSDSLSNVLLELDRVAIRPGAGALPEKPDPDVRFSSGVVVMLTDDEREFLEEQNEAFREKFGRDPEPEDPIFFDPEKDEPELMSKEKFDRIVTLVEEFGATEYSKRMAAAKVRAGMMVRVDADEQTPYGEVNPVPMLLSLTNAAGIEDDLQTRCLHVAVHAWAEGHLAAPEHPKPVATDVPLHVPPFPDPTDDGERLAALVALAEERVNDGGSEIAAIVIAAGLAWEYGWRQGIECKGCAIENADSPFARAMRCGEIGISFAPILRAPEESTIS